MNERLRSGGIRSGWRQPRPIDDRASSVAGLSERVENLKGRRAALQERHDALERDVGLAKGRIAAKGDVEKFIQELQADAYRKSTHSFETLLTAITQEVLPGAKPIALDLTTERGLPSLSISAVGRGDNREDIFEDHGGALANVIGMGLRLIAVVKSRGQRFLALDEPECWTAPERVPAFFAVLEDAARRLDVQCLTITHHKGSANFSADVRVSKLIGNPEAGASVECDMPPPAWTDDMIGFRYIRLRNFQAFPDARIDLAPGINAITGDNNHGKSGFMRALRAVFYGDTTDRHIRHGADSVTVEIGLQAGRYLKFTRVRKGSPKNVWSLHEADGSVVVENGELRQTGGNEPPAWVDAAYGIVRHDGHDIHISHQKYPVFLIDKPGSKRAAVLSFGQESGYTNDMLAIQKERVTKDNALVREGEREIGTLRTQLAELAGLDDMASSVEAARELSGRIEASEMRLKKLQGMRDRLAGAAAVQERASYTLKALASLPEPQDARNLELQLSTVVQGERIRGRLLEANASLTRTTAILSALAILPEKPELLDLTPAESLIEKMSAARRAADAAGRRLDILSALPDLPPQLSAAEAVAVRERYARTLNQSDRAAVAIEDAESKIGEIKIEMEAAIDEGGGRCPTCGGTVDPTVLFHEHAA